MNIDEILKAVKGVLPSQRRDRHIGGQAAYRKQYRAIHGRPDRGAGTGSHHKSKFAAKYFIAWDGEGVQYGEPEISKTLVPVGKRKDNLLEERTVKISRQNYALLANSEGDYLISAEGLSTIECLDFFTSSKYPRHAIHVIFGGDYDFTMSLKDLSEEQLRTLRKGNKPVYYGPYEITYRPRKCLNIRKMKVEYRNGKIHKCFNRKTNKMIVERSVTIWDTFGFFQMRFVKVLEKWTKGTEYEETYKSVLGEIEAGKARRGSFTPDELERYVLPYTLNEVRGLRDICRILHGYISEAELSLSRWDGAGAVAAATLKKYDVKHHFKDKEGNDLSPQEVILAAEYAYFGGRIEAVRFGNFNASLRRWKRKIFHYDERSAYPSVMPTLLSLLHGRWVHWKIPKNTSLRDVSSVLKQSHMFLALVYWNVGDVPITPLPWRAPNGAVLVPPAGMGWYWHPEVLALIDLFPKAEAYVMDVWEFIPEQDSSGRYLPVYPFEFVTEWYNRRRKHQQEGKGVEKVEKLALNSEYGKFAQSLGYNSDRRIKPPYHSIIYAGIITSQTRANLLRAAMQAPHDIISFATDGIFSLSPLELNIGENLGEWEYKEHTEMTILQSGFYWLTNPDGSESAYYRGFDKDSVSRQGVIDAWFSGEEYLRIPTTRFMTIGACMGLNDFSVLGAWRTIDRKLNIRSGSAQKRETLEPEFRGTSVMFPTRPRQLPPMKNIMSKKYEFQWDEQEDDLDMQGLFSKEEIAEKYWMELSIVDER